MSALSQDLYAASGVPLSAVGSGGGGGIPPNPTVSTISVLGITNLSSINGQPYTPGSLPANASFQNVSTQGLLVSSINGAPVGGAVAANLVVSSLTAASGVSTLGTLSVGGNLAVSAGSIMSYGSTFFTASGLNGTQLNLTAPNGAVALISPSTVVAASGGAPSYVSMPGNLQVSTINGGQPFAAKSLGGYNINVGSFSTTQGQFFPNDLSNKLYAMSTIAGHSYRLDLLTQITPAQPSVVPASIPADNSLIVYVNNGSNTVYTDSIPTGDVYNISRGPLSSFRAAYSIPFLATGANATAYIAYANNNANNFVFTNATNISSAGAGLLTDLGTV